MGGKAVSGCTVESEEGVPVKMQEVCCPSQQPRMYLPSGPSSGRIKKSWIQEPGFTAQIAFLFFFFGASSFSSPHPSHVFLRYLRSEVESGIWEGSSGSCSAQAGICLKYFGESVRRHSGRGRREHIYFHSLYESQSGMKSYVSAKFWWSCCGYLDFC